MNEKSFSGSTSNNEAINQLHLEDNIVISAPGKFLCVHVQRFTQSSFS